MRSEVGRSAVSTTNRLAGELRSLLEGRRSDRIRPETG